MTNGNKPAPDGEGPGDEAAKEPNQAALDKDRKDNPDTSKQANDGQDEGEGGG